MMSGTEQIPVAPVRKSIRVRASVERAFQVFTSEMDSWWPRSHHIGNAPMKRVLLEGRPGGRCYSEQVDGTECEWGSVLVWEPPLRFVIAWQIGASWKYEPELAKASEVEVRFMPEGEGFTRVELEHRYFERHGAGMEAIRTAVDDENGWNGLLRLFGSEAERVGEGTAR